MRALQQGEADGLCGIYAALNFLQSTAWQDSEGKGLWYLLDAARQLGCFTPQHVVEGFEDHNLKAILDIQFENYRLPYETYFIDDVCRSLKIASLSQLVRRVASFRGSVIAHSERRKHWVLIHCADGEAVILDSANGSGSSTLFKFDQKSLNNRSGVVILPTPRKPLEIEL